jgi:hypothetical protein
VNAYRFRRPSPHPQSLALYRKFTTETQRTLSVCCLFSVLSVPLWLLPCPGWRLGEGLPHRATDTRSHHQRSETLALTTLLWLLPSSRMT